MIKFVEPNILDVVRDGQVTAPEVRSESSPKYKLDDVAKNTQALPFNTPPFKGAFTGVALSSLSFRISVPVSAGKFPVLWIKLEPVVPHALPIVPADISVVKFIAAPPLVRDS